MNTTKERITLEPTDRRLEARLGEAMLSNLIETQDSETALKFDVENLFAPELDQDPILKISEVGGSEGIFNVTVLEIGESEYLFGRKVTAAAGPGDPDFGSLVLAELGPTRDIVSTTEVWNPAGKDFLIEDPRARRAADGVTTIGVTLVRSSDKKYFPGYIKIKSTEELLNGPFPEPRIINKFGSGNQTTPVGEDIGQDVEGKNTTTVDGNLLMYRPDQMNHSLHVLDCTEDEAVHVGFIDFPKDIAGSSYKIGTTTPPEWLNDREAFFVIHGLDKTIDGEVVAPDTIDERVVFQYCINTCRLVRSLDENGRVAFTVDNISRKPIVTVNTFPSLGDDRQIELHPIRRVTYSCGGKGTRNENNELIREELLLNQGDMRLFDAEVAADEIIAGWDRRLPGEYRQS